MLAALDVTVQEQGVSKQEPFPVYLLVAPQPMG